MRDLRSAYAVATAHKSCFEPFRHKFCQPLGSGLSIYHPAADMIETGQERPGLFNQDQQKQNRHMISQRSLKAHVKGILSYIPGADWVATQKGAGPFLDGSYSYGIWMKHLTLLWASGYRKMPRTVVEFGPGDDIGAGIAALLCGANEYYGLDVLSYSNVEANHKVFQEQIDLFRNRAPRPAKGWPDFDEHLDANLFPSHILTDELLEKSLAPERLKAIERAILQPEEKNDIKIQYVVPWTSGVGIPEGAIDLCFSHGVLQYVDNLDHLFNTIARMLAPDGATSHQLDLSCINASIHWNGHRAMSDLSWRIMKGNRPFWINGHPYSYYKKLVARHDLRMITDMPQIRHDGLKREQLKRKWQNLSDIDMHSAGLLFQATR